MEGMLPWLRIVLKSGESIWVPGFFAPEMPAYDLNAIFDGWVADKAGAVSAEVVGDVATKFNLDGSEIAGMCIIPFVGDPYHMQVDLHQNQPQMPSQPQA